jgi:hypothetical protein
VVDYQRAELAVISVRVTSFMIPSFLCGFAALREIFFLVAALPRPGICRSYFGFMDL